PGTYAVSLVAIATETCRDTLVIPDLIVLEGPIGDFSFAIDTSCVPLQVAFTGNSANLYDYIWDFGNGQLDTTLNVTDDQIGFSYEEPGAFVPKLILVDAANCVRAIESPDTIQVATLDVNFTATDSVLCDDQSSITLLNQSSSTTPIVAVEWSMEGQNPTISTAAQPQVIYNTPGVYDIGLTVDNGFCQETLVKPNFIRVGTVPIAAFSPQDTLGCTPFTLNFTDESTSDIGAITNWEWNFGDSTISNLPAPQHTFTTSDTFAVSLTVTTDTGCRDTVIHDLTVLPAPMIDFANLNPICRGERLPLQATIEGDTSSLTFFWLDDPTLSCTQCLHPIASPLDTTIYGLVWNNPNGCTDTIEVEVQVRPDTIPIIGLTPDTSICANDLIQLQASGGDDVWSYQWEETRLGLSCYTACKNPIATPLSNTVYVVEVTNAAGCVARDSVRIDVVDAFQPIAGADRTICQGDSLQLQVDVGSEWVWLNPDQLTCAFCPDPIAFPDTSRIYTIEALTDIGCLIQDSILIEVLMSTAVDAGTDLALCEGDSIALNGEGNGVLSWTPEGSLNNPNLANPIAQPLVSTTYTLRVTNDLCELSDSVRVEVLNQTEIEGLDEMICQGDTVALNFVGAANVLDWSPTDRISDPQALGPLVWPDTTTTYTLIGQLSTCLPDTTQLTIWVDALPGVSISTVYPFFPGQIIQLNPRIDDDRPYRFEWMPMDSLSCGDCPNPLVRADTSRAYTLLVSEETTGCVTTLDTRLEPLAACPEDLIYIPNAFSPNDDGENDVLRMYSNAFERISTFKVFNRWGALVFETSDIREEWNGQIGNKNLPAGVYIYFLEAPCPINPQLTVFKKGDITLIR
ncbi:MAG: PKD domain-containing protein, partial [Bacteroidota bacterium]